MHDRIPGFGIDVRVKPLSLIFHLRVGYLFGTVRVELCINTRLVSTWVKADPSPVILDPDCSKSVKDIGSILFLE